MNKFAEVIFNLPINHSFIYDSTDFPDLIKGMRVMVQLGKRRMMGFVTDVRDSPGKELFEIKSVDSVLDKRPVFTEDVLKMAKWLSTMYMCSVGEALGVMIPGGRREIEIDIKAGDSSYPLIGELSLHQKNAVDRILSREKGIFYLNGVTGSGKTEVYLRVAEQILKKGGGVLYLVPEIALTHQIVDLLKSRFGNRVVILHSGLTPSQRLNGWLRLIEGKASVAVGARSSVFAPVRNLKLIIVDEEHESSYKSGFSPRYHARQVAIYRSRKENALLVLGSATPSLEAYYYMKKGKIEEIELPERLSGGNMPLIEIVDMRKEKSPLSKKLIRAIRDVHSEGKQTILFLNRRGFAYFFHCRSCGYEMKCKNCSVPLTFHKSKNEMVCHYCGYRTKPVDRCPECGSLDVGYSGFGTERIEREIERIFPGYSIKRIDSDSIKKKMLLREVFDNFGRGEIDILLGTQMVAKGLNFPGVKLVGIVLVDTDLKLPDFRSQERTFQLLVQVAGRAGRFISDSRVIIQTYNPSNWIIQLASKSNLDDFYRKELEMRKALDFPPFSRMIRIVFRGRNKNDVIKNARSFSDQLDSMKRDLDVLGPVECPLSYIARNYRIQVIIRSKNIKALHSGVRQSVESFKVSHSVHMEIDVDPVSLL